MSQGEGAIMSTTTRSMTAEDVIKFDDPSVRVELIRGELRTMPLPGGRHGMNASEVHFRLNVQVRANDLGVVFAAEAGFLIERDPDTVRGADVAFVRRERMAQVVNLDKHIPFAPDLAIEVVSPSDRGPAVAAKALDWLAAGAAMVWNLHPKTRSASVYRPGQEPVELSEEDFLEGGDVVPGFRCRVGDLFV
jgi:Uma2 family endonuclease